MKFIVLALALFGAVAYASAQNEEETYFEPYVPARFRREDNPRGSVVIQAQKPMSGPDRRPSLDVDYHQRVYDKNGGTASTYGGLNIRPGMAPQPHIGIQAEKTYKNGFINGFGQVQRGPGGRPSPTFGIRTGFRFRRSANDFDGEEDAY